ncbi:MAG: PDR/VanB family oxidoreductase [Stellaceae bacterium]
MRGVIDWHPARLNSVRDLTADIRLFEIEPLERHTPPIPGSHINVSVQLGERPDVRSYSILGACADGLYRIAVKRLPAGRGGSAYMWSLAPGARLTISEPGNHFALSPGRPDYLLIAGGIGITPIYTMALALAQAGAPFRLLYAGRRRRDLAFADELREGIGDRLEIFVGEEGSRIEVAAEIGRLASGGELYACGPLRLLDAVRQAWAESGRPVEGLRFETFGNSGRYAAEPFNVTLSRLRREITVARNETLLDALEAAGIEMIADCRRGECGLCAVDVLAVDGIIDHRDVFFSESQKAANKQICTCVSRVVKGGIVIDTADRID